MTQTTTVHLVDRFTVDATSKREYLPNGFMRVPARIARTGIQVYLARELGLTDRKPDEEIRVYRPPEEVFSAESLRTISHAPITDDHPATMVTKDNATQLTKGWGAEVVREDDGAVSYQKTTLTFTDAALITKAEAGKVELSNGYDTQLEWTAGTTPAGESYDAIQRKIVGNHIAVVDAGRCGENCRIADQAMTATVDCQCGAKTGDSHMADPAVKTIVVDSVPVSVTDAAEAIIRKLEGQAQTASDRVAKAEADAATAVQAKDARITELEAELAAVKATVPTGAALDAMVADRQALIVTAKRIHPALDATGKTDGEIRKLAVIGKLGDAACAGKEDAFFTHAYDALVVQLPALDATGNPTTPAATGITGQDALAAAVQSVQPTADAATQVSNAWDESVKSMQDAWKQPTPAAA